MPTNTTEDLSGGIFEQARRDAIRIWLACITGALLVAYVLDLLQRIDRPFPGFFPSSNLTLVRVVSGLWGVAAIAMIPYLRRHLLLHTTFKPMPRKSKFSPRALQLLMPEIVTFALCASIWMDGLLPLAINGALYDYYWFAAVALVLLGVNFPSRQRWVRMARAVARANL